MSTVNGVTQTKQQTYTASDVKQQSASNVSVFNANETDSAYHRGDQTAWEWELKIFTENFNITEEEVYKFLEETFGYTKDYLLGINSEKATEISILLENVFERLIKSKNRENDLIQITEDTKKLIANGNNIKEIGEYIETYRNGSILQMLKQSFRPGKKFEGMDENGKPIYTDLEDIVGKDLIKKLENAKSLDDLTHNELSVLITNFISLFSPNNDNNAGLRMFKNMLDVNLSDVNIKENNEEHLGKMYSKLYNAFKHYANISGEQGAIEAILDRCKGKASALNSFLDNDKFNDIFTRFNYKPQELRALLTDIQLSLPDENGEPNQVLVDKLIEYIKPLQEEVLNIEIRKKSGENISDKEKETIELFNKIKERAEEANIHILTFATEEKGKEVHAQVNELDKFDAVSKKNIYKGIHENSLKYENLDPFKIQEKLDRYSNNEYSETLKSLGLELPTPENIDSLREKAKNGTLIESDNDSSELGYVQSSENKVNLASYKAETILSYISANSPEETFKVEGKVDAKIDTKQTKPVNVANLGNYSGEELQLFIKKRFVKFSDAIKQYTSKLSESGKQFIVNEIKNKNKSEQAYALNSANNTAKFDIMKKADLFDKGLNVEFDTIHQKLAENYSA